jgi:hypothetical protein
MNSELYWIVFINSQGNFVKSQCNQCVYYGTIGKDIPVSFKEAMDRMVTHSNEVNSGNKGEGTIKYRVVSLEEYERNNRNE